jgi:hypothetical protein
VFTPLSSVFSSIYLSAMRTVAIANREIHDEPEAADLGDCVALGELGLIFSTENNGALNVGVVVTDPRGRRIGFDPLTKSSWDELRLAQGFINCDASYADGRCRGIVQVCGPVSGGYKVEVVGQSHPFTVSVVWPEVNEQRSATVSTTRFQKPISGVSRPVTDLATFF